MQCDPNTIREVVEPLIDKVGWGLVVLLVSVVLLVFVLESSLAKIKKHLGINKAKD